MASHPATRISSRSTARSNSTTIDQLHNVELNRAVPFGNPIWSSAPVSTVSSNQGGVSSLQSTVSSNSRLMSPPPPPPPPSSSSSSSSFSTQIWGIANSASYNNGWNVHTNSPSPSLLSPSSFPTTQNDWPSLSESIQQSVHGNATPTFTSPKSSSIQSFPLRPNTWSAITKQTSRSSSKDSNSSLNQQMNSANTSNNASLHNPQHHSFRPNTTNLDRFATVYVPQILRDISNAHPSRVEHPRDVPLQDPLEYAKAIYPQNLLDTILSEKSSAEKQMSSETILNDIEPIHLEKLCNSSLDETYAKKLLKMQNVEFLQRQDDLSSSTLYNVNISAAIKEDIPSGLFKLEAPEIREGYPALDINDVVFLRHIRGSPTSVVWDGVLYIASVQAVQRAAGIVIVKCPAIIQLVHSSTQSFIVSFEPQGRPFYMVREGLIRLHQNLQHQHGLQDHTDHPQQRSLLHDWLFPENESYQALDTPPHTGPSEKLVAWQDTSLNAEQQHAVRSFVHYRRRAPYLISGPPGTGKTKTIIEMVLQIISLRPTASILLCGASNPSTDTLALRLSSHLDPKVMLRLHDESRPLDEVNDRLLPYCKIIGGRFGVPDFSTMKSYRVIVTSALDSSILNRYNFTNDSLARLEYNIYSNWMPTSYKPQNYHFDYFILDEAAQLCEQDIAPAFNVLLPSLITLEAPEHATRQVPQICLVGDHHQLGPFVSSFEARNVEMDLSLLQRLLERPVYNESCNSRQQLAQRQLLLTDGSREKASTLDTLDVEAPLCNLVRNYRSHVGLLMIPSTLFYNDTLVPAAASMIQNTHLLNWPRLNGSKIPLLLRHIEGREDAVLEGSSWYNTVELQNVIAIVRDLTGLRGSASGLPEAVKPSEISIISPFREQVWKIRIALRRLGLGNVNVGRESDLQGAENRVIIISTVRTSDRFLQDDRRRNRGLIFEPKRFNVATTRAKELLIILGHVKTLYIDPCWRTLVNFAVRQGCYHGPPVNELGLELDPASGLSRLEESFMSRDVTLKGRKTAHDVLAGSVVRIALSGGSQ